MKVFLINLDRSPERLQFMRQQFERIGLDFERQAAVDGSKIDLTPYEGSGLMPGEIGCFLSHRGIWNKLVESDDEFALVIEDDVRLSEALPALIAETDWIPATAGVVKLDTSMRHTGISKARRTAPSGREIHILRGEHTGTGGYIIRRSYAAELLSNSEKLAQAVDIFMFGKRAVQDANEAIWQMIPAAVAQEKRFGKALPAGLDSVIQHHRTKVRPPLISLVLREVARAGRKFWTKLDRMRQQATSDIRYRRIPFRE
jgi:glycosyl transferase family 25